MINFMRLHFKKGVLLVVLIIVVLGFVLFGATSRVSVSPNSYVIKVGDRTLTPQQFQQFTTNIQISMNRYPQLNAQINQLSASYPNLNREQRIQMWIIQQTVNNFVLLNGLEKMGMSIGDNTLARIIAQQWQQKDGKFNQQAFVSYLEQANLTEKEFKDDVRDTLLTKEFSYLISSMPVPTNLIKKFFQFSLATWDISYAVIPYDSFHPTPLTITELKAYYKQHQSQYVLPEQRSASILFVTSNTLESSVSVSKTDVEALYNQQKSRFGDAEQRAFIYYVFPTKDVAQKAYQQLSKNPSIAKVTESYHKVSFKSMTKKDITIQSVAHSVFKDGMGQYSQPIQLATGWAIVKTTKIVPAHYTPLSKVFTQLQQEARIQKAQGQVANLETSITKDLATGLTLQTIASKYHLSLQNVKDVTLTNIRMNKQQNPNQPIAINRSILQSVFTTDQNHTSNLMTMHIKNSSSPSAQKQNMPKKEDNGFYVIHVNNIQKKHTPTFESIQAQVQQDSLENKKKQQAQQQAQSLIASIQKSGAWTEATSLTNHLTFTLNKTKNPIAYVIANNAEQDVNFKPGLIATTSMQNVLIVYKILSITPASTQKNPEQYANFSAQFAKLYDALIFEEFQNIYAKDFPQKINPHYMPKNT